MKAAGVLFLSLNGNALFLRRTGTAPDCPGCWDFPGGGQEGDETAEQTALREAREEIGTVPDGIRTLHVRTKSVTAGVMVSPPSPPAAGPGGASVDVPVDGASPAAAVDFTTYLQKVTNEFVPELNDEHDGWAWAPPDSPPQPLHPGCQIALDRLGMNELDVARAIAAGRLTSPQRYNNVWLFAIRISGTGIAYREKLNEFVQRSPSLYLNDEFLARCNGLAVVYRQRSGTDETFHPKDGLLNSDEFADRVVGSIFLPYIAGSEVWGIAKIYDDAVASRMESEQLSTSPAVWFDRPDDNVKLKLADGSTLLIEDDPSLLDHVAVCEQGVWDKGGDPTGVRSESREDSAMTAEEKAKADAEEKARKDAEEKAKADADVGTKLDKMLSGIDAMHAKWDSLSKRMDAMEERDDARRKDAHKDDAHRDDAKRKDDEGEDKDDPEKLAADKAKKDAEEKEKEEKAAADAKAKKDAEEKEEKERADAKKRADEASANDATRRRIEEVAAMVTPLADDEHEQLANAWTRADEVFSALGQKTPRAMPGETAKQYRRRVAKALQSHSQQWKGVELKTSVYADDAAFSIAENQIYADASAAARSPATVAPGTLRMVEKRENGHIIREYVGESSAWMNRFAGPVQLKGTGRFKTPSNFA